MVVFTTDHGSYHGEHGYIGKKPHLYEEVAQIPLIMRMPDKADIMPRRYASLVQPPDIMPTILALTNTKIPNTVQGKPLLPIIDDTKSQIHDIP